MTKLSLIISWVSKIIASILTVMLIIQAYDAFTKESRFLFFQVILMFVWGIGALIFWIVGIAVGRTYSRQSKHLDQGNSD